MIDKNNCYTEITSGSYESLRFSWEDNDNNLDKEIYLIKNKD